MSEQELDNEATATAVEPPPEEKLEKPARKPRKAKADKAAAPSGTDPGCRNARHPRPEGNEASRPLQARQRPRRRKRHRHAEAGPDLLDPAGPDRKNGTDFLGGRSRMPAGRIRIPASSGI